MKEKIIIAMLFLLLGIPANAQDDGPRLYWNSPVGTNVMEVYAWFSQSNSLNGNNTLFSPDIISNSTMVIINYNRYFDVVGRNMIFTASLPMGNATADIDTNTTQSTRGIADFYLQSVINILGAPALSLEEFAEYEQKTVLSFLAGVSIPTGNYNSDKIINMGENRWGFRLGIPFVQKIGPWLPGKLTTIEITPSAWFFTNNESFVNDLILEQETFFMVETHITRDITEKFFLSLDHLYQHGGETILNGLNQNDATSANFIGATLGFAINEELQFNFRYTASLKPDDDDIDMDILKLNFSYIW